MNVKRSQDVFAFLMGMQKEAGDIAVFTPNPRAEWAERTVGSPMCEHSNPIALVSTVMSNLSLSLKYSRAELKCLFSDEPRDSEQRKHVEIEYFGRQGRAANDSGFVHSCINLFFL